MTDEFMREERYIVFKVSDVERYLTDKDRANIAMMKMEIAAGRDCANKPPFKGLIVEADWPEYEPTWKAIEARVTGTQQVPDGTAIQTAARILNIDLIRQRDELRAKIEQMEQIAPSVPRESIEKMLTQLMDIAVSNGANSVSMPDEYVEIAAWLCGIPAQPAQGVPAGWKLVPIEPTPMMKTAGIGVEVYQDSPPSSDCLTWEEVEAIYTAMLAAAPDAKP